MDKRWTKGGPPHWSPLAQCAILGAHTKHPSARARGDPGLAREHLRACRAIREAAGDRRGLAKALAEDSQNVVESGVTDEAVDLARRSLAIYEELGEAAGQAYSLGRLGVVQMWAGLFTEAQRTLVASRALYQALGNELMVAYDNNRLAIATMAVGDLEEAWALAMQSIDRSRALLGGDERQALMVGGWSALMRGDRSEAARLLQASIELTLQLGQLAPADWARPWLATTRWLLGRRAEARADLLAVLRATTRHNYLSVAALHTPGDRRDLRRREYARARAQAVRAGPAASRDWKQPGSHNVLWTAAGRHQHGAAAGSGPGGAGAWARARSVGDGARTAAELEAAGWGAGEAEM